MDSIPTLLLLLPLSMLLLLRQQVGALKLFEVKVPSYLRRGESPRLECSYDLGSDNLYTIAWYKDNDHIYKYSRGSEKKTFTVDGVTIDVHNSNDRTLRLQDVSLDSTGLYECEVNVDSTPFKVARKGAYMEVIELPRNGPKITGEEKIYATGDILALNCTSDPSHPPAQLQWFINDVEVNPDSEVKYPKHYGLHSTHSSLKLELYPLHLTNGRIEVKCVSTVRTSPQAAKAFEDRRETKIYVQGHASLSTPSLSVLLLLLLLPSLLLRND